MMISTKAKIAFLAMPRAASTSIETELLPFADIAFKGFPRFKHINLSIYNMRLRPFLVANNFDDIETTAIFREPISWLKSWFNYRSDPQIKLKRNSTAGVSFNEFVEAYLMEDTPNFAKVGQQCRFVQTNKSKCGIDYLFKFENLPHFSAFLSERFASEFHFKPSNQSKNLGNELSPALKRALEDRFKADFDIHDQAI